MAHEADLLRGLEPAVRPAGAPAPASRPSKPIERSDFREIFDRHRSQPLKLSAHAQQRLADRGVELSEAQWSALNDAALRAEAKGAKDALMLMDRLGLIVNVPNRTVLTVLPEERMKEGIITQIDSAVLVDEPAKEEEPHRLNL